TSGRRERSKLRRHAPEVVQGEQRMRRQTKLAEGFAGQLACGLNFQIAPGTARLAGLIQPVKLRQNTTGELTASSAAAAGGDKGCGARLVFLHPEEETRTLRIVAKPVQPQF